MELFEEIPLFKRVYQTVSGTCEAASASDITELLTRVSEYLIDGLTSFRPYAGETRQWERIIGTRQDLGIIVKQLALATDVEIAITWSMFCNYLTFIYHGRAEDIQHIARHDLKLMHFVEMYEHFYFMERMYMLKTLHHILNNYDNELCKFRQCYATFLDGVPMFKIRQSLLNQYHVLHVRLLSDRYRFENMPIIRCVNELKEICIMLLASSWGRGRCIHFGAGEMGAEIQPLMQQLVHIVQGVAHRKYGLLLQFHEILGEPALLDLHYAHIAMLLVPFEQLWINFRLWQPFRIEFTRVFIQMTYTSDNDFRAIFALHWALMILRDPAMYDREANFEDTYRTLIINSLQRGAMRMLATICNSTVVKDMAEGHQVRFAIYRLFQELFVRLDADDGLYDMPGLVSLLIALLRDGQVGLAILSGDNELGALPMSKINRVITMVEELFPFDFVSYSSVLHTMMKHDSYQKMAFEKITNMSIFAEQRYEDSQLFVLIDYRPLGNDTVVIAAEQEPLQVRRRDEDVIVYNTTGYVYFDVLYTLIQRYLSRVQDRIGHTITVDEYSTAIIAGLNLMMDIVDNYKRYTKYTPFVRCMNQVFNIILFNFETATYEHDLVMASLKLCGKMMTVVPEKIITFLIGMRVLPAIHADYYCSEEFMSLNNLNIGPQLLVVVDNDSQEGRGEIVDLFINIIKYAIRTDQHYRSVQLPLAVFIFQKLFTKFHLNAYEYCLSGFRVRTVIKIVKLLHRILAKEPHNESANKLRAQCLELVLTKAPFIESFLHSVVRNPNVTIQLAVTYRPSWANIETVPVVKLAKLCISVLLLLIQITGGMDEMIKRPLGIVLANSRPEATNNIKILATLINNNFDANLREATCRLFCKFAQNTSITLLSHLEMDSYQIRSMFLEKLRDPLEDNRTKVAIVDFIAASVTHQNALTAAFFNFLKYMEEDTLDLSDNVSSFIVEHLQNIQANPVLWDSPIQQAVLNLLERIWWRGMEIVLAPLINLPNFWVNLACPLFDEFNAPNNNYAIIINIFNIQLRMSAASGRPNPDEFNFVVNEMFDSPAGSFAMRLIRYLRETLKNADEYDWTLLQSTRNFLMIVSSQRSDLFIDPESKSELTFNCLESLREYMKSPDDIKIVECWLGTYLHLISLWSASCYTNFESDTIFVLTDISYYFVCRYTYMSVSSKATLLSIFCNTLPNLSHYADNHPKCLWPLLHAMRKIMDKEQSLFHVENDQSACSSTWTLTIILTRQLLTMPCAGQYKSWLTSENFFQQIIETARRFMARTETLPSARLALLSLIEYVNNDVHGTIALPEWETFCRKVYPPEEYLDFRPYDTVKYHETPFEEVWLSYIALVQYNTALLRTRSPEHFDVCISFYRMHSQALYTFMKLPSMTVQLTALHLVQSILDFGLELLLHTRDWNIIEYGPKMISDFFVMLRMSMNSCIQIMLSPNIIYFFKSQNWCPLNVEQVSDDIYVNIIEEIIDIISKSCICLDKASSSHLDLLTAGVSKRRLIDLNMIDADFSIPKISSSLNTKLSYGDLLFLHQILVQILYKVHAQRRPYEAELEAANADEADEAASNALRQAIDKQRRLRMQERRSFETTTVQCLPRHELLALVCPDYVHRGVADWSTRRVPEPDISGMTAPWLHKLDESLTLCAFEALTTYLGKEMQRYLYTFEPKTPEYVFYRRHFSTEFQTFHDYVTKWRCGNVSLDDTVASIAYHRSLEMPVSTASQRQFDAHSVIAPPRVPSSLSAASLFSLETPVPRMFQEWQQDYEVRLNHFFIPPEPGPDTAERTMRRRNYLLMLSHWLHYLCNSTR